MLKEKDARTCLHKIQTKDHGNCLTSGEKIRLRGLQWEAGESVPCISSLMIKESEKPRPTKRRLIVHVMG